MFLATFSLSPWNPLPLFFFFKCFQKLVAADGIGAKLGYDDTGSKVCQAAAVCGCDTAGDAHGEDGDDGITSTGDVEDFLRFGRNVLDLLLPDEGEAGFGAGDDDAAEMESFHHVASCLFDGRVFIADRIGENGVDFLEVRRDVVSAGILHPVRPFRIHDDRHVVRLTGSDDFLAVFFGACPFAVVGNDETVQPSSSFL